MKLEIGDLILIRDALNDRIAKMIAIPRYGIAHDMSLLRDVVQEEIDKKRTEQDA